MPEHIEQIKGPRPAGHGVYEQMDGGYLNLVHHAYFSLRWLHTWGILVAYSSKYCARHGVHEHRGHQAMRLDRVVQDATRQRRDCRVAPCSA